MSPVLLNESERERRLSEIEREIERLRRKYGMDFDEFFEKVESFSGLKELMKSFELGEILEDSLRWEELEDELRVLKGSPSTSLLL